MDENNLLELELPAPFVGTSIVIPKPLFKCVKKVIEGEYAFPRCPDLPPIKRILDVGANVGAFAIWAHAQWRDAWIDCYEPHPGAYEFCHDNVPPGTQVHNVAITANPSKDIKLYVGKGDDWGYNSLDGNLNPTDSENCINVLSMHPKQLPPCDLLKLDCEGAELEILQCYPHLHRCHVVMIEWHREEELLSIMSIMQSVGLRLVRSTHDFIGRGQLIYVRSALQFNMVAGRYECPDDVNTGDHQLPKQYEHPRCTVAISHTPWVHERVVSLERLMDQLKPSIVRLFQDKEPNHVWSLKMWKWASECEKVFSHHLFLQDDVIVCENFWSAIGAMLEAVPDKIIALEAVHPLGPMLHQLGRNWYATRSWLIGVGYIFPHDLLLEFLDWRTGSIGSTRAQMISEDSLINEWVSETGREVWHPIPTIIDHDVLVKSTYDNDNHTHRRPTVLWTEEDSKLLESVEYWKPGIVALLKNPEV